MSLRQILQLGDTFYFFLLLLTGVMRKEKGGKREKKKMDERQEEREKENGEVDERIEERTEEGTEEGTQETEERLELTEEACEEEERCEEDLESQSAAKRARVSQTFTDSQETAIVEFVKEHPELYDKELAHFHNRQKKEALWAEISAELKLQPFDLRRWFESQRTRHGKLSKLQSGQAPREMTKRQSWVYQQMGFLKTHIRRKGASRSSGFEASPNTSKQDESRGLLLMQNTLSPVSLGRVGVNLCSHLHQFQQTPRYSSTLTR